MTTEPANLLQQIVKAAPGLKVTGIYQDPKSRAWAEDLWNRVTELAGADAILVEAWNLDELNHTPAFQEAVSAAAVADVLIISIHAGEQLPPGLCAWIDAWLPHRQRRDGALIALLGVAPGQPEIPLAWAKEYLRAIAFRSGLDFQLREYVGAFHGTKISTIGDPLSPANASTNNSLQPKPS